MKKKYEQKMKDSLEALGFGADFDFGDEELDAEEDHLIANEKKNDLARSSTVGSFKERPGGSLSEVREESKSKDSSNSDNEEAEEKQAKEMEEYSRRLIAQTMKKKLSWNNKSFSEKFALFNKWAIVALLGNLCTFFGCFYFVMLSTFDVKQMELFLGIGCMLTWFSFTRYYENNRDFNLISRTASQAIPYIARTFVGFLPTLIGFSLLGMCILWPYAEKFGGFAPAMVILFSVMNGDSISDVFIGSTKSRFILGQIYWYTFIFVGVILFQNILFVVVEDCYNTVKYQKSYEWARADDEISEHSDAEPEEEGSEGSSSSDDSDSSDEDRKNKKAL